MPQTLDLSKFKKVEEDDEGLDLSKFDKPKVEDKVEEIEENSTIPETSKFDSTKKSAPEKSWLSKAWDFATEPLSDAPSRFAKSVSKWATTPELGDQTNPVMPYLKGAIGGIAEGLGNIGDSLTSPLSIATLGLGGAELASVKAGAPELAQIANIGTRMLSTPIAAHGAYDLARPDANLQERAQGLVELAGGGAGMVHSPSVKTKVRDIPEVIPESVSNSVPEDLSWVTKELNDLKEGKYTSRLGELENITRNSPFGEGSIVPSEVRPTELSPISGEIDTGNKFRLDDVPDLTGDPSFVPVGSERTYNNMFDKSQLGVTEENIFANARNKQGMGLADDSIYPEGSALTSKKPSEIFDKPFDPNILKFEEKEPQLNLELFEDQLKSSLEKSKNNKYIPEAHEQLFIKDLGMTPEEYFKMSPEEADNLFNIEWKNQPPEKLNDGGIELDTTDPNHMEVLSNIINDEINKPTAEFLGLQQDGQPLFNIKGGPKDKSTVSLQGLKDLGIEAPEVPADAKPMRGEELRRIALEQKKATANDKPIAKPSSQILEEDGFSQTENNGNNIPPNQPPNNSPIPNDDIPKKINEIAEQAKNEKDPSLLRQALNFNKSLLTAWDLSAPGRQGKAFMLNKSWWTSLDDMVKAWGSEAAAKNISESIQNHPSGLFKVGENGKSFADEAGLHLPLHEEFFQTRAGKALNKYSGVDKSSRAHTAFLNKLRSDQFASFIEQSQKAGIDPTKNLPLAKAYAEFINNATGRGSLNFGDVKLEGASKALNDLLFAPRNMSGQIRTWNAVLNPVSYYKTDSVLRKQALRSLFAIAGTGLAVNQLAKLGGAKIETDPSSSDFQKIRFGNTRIDNFGGYQQFPVAAMKFLMGKSKSTTSGKITDLTGNRFGQQTRASVAERFFTNRLAPLPSFVWAWMNNREFDGKPFEVKRALFERTFPIAMKDIYELAQEDPKLGAILAPSTILGLSGTQVYGK